MTITENSTAPESQNEPQGDESTTEGTGTAPTDTEAADSQQDTETEGTETEADTDTENDDTPENDDAQPKNKRTNEAAKYRTRLREAEGERDQLRGRLETIQKTTLDKHLEYSGINLRAASIDKLGHSTAELVNDDLSINAEQLAEVLQSIKDDGFDVSDPKPTTEKLTELYGIRDKSQLEFLATIPNNHYQELFAEHLDKEARRRVNARVGTGRGFEEDFDGVTWSEALGKEH
ncbi:hypothetical protein ACT3R5_14950 [Glutamicibacter sp. AOP5-A2-7]